MKALWSAFLASSFGFSASFAAFLFAKAQNLPNSDQVIQITLPLTALLLLAKILVDLLFYRKNSANNNEVETALRKIAESFEQISIRIQDIDKTLAAALSKIEKLYEMHNVVDEKGRYIWWSRPSSSTIDEQTIDVILKELQNLRKRLEER